MKLNTETKVGLMATFAITLLILGFNFLKGNKIFTAGFELKAYYDNVAGLNVGNPVLYNGWRVGSVKTIEVDTKTGIVEVAFSLDEGMLVPVDSKANITSADLLGSKAIKIERGFSEQIVDNGGILRGEREESLEEKVMKEILPIKDNVDDLITQMERFVGWLNNTMDPSAGNKIDNILDDFSTTTRNFARSSYRFDTLLGTFQATAYNANRVIRNLRNQNETINRIMDNTANFTDSLATTSSSVKQIISEAANLIGDIEGILAKVEAGDGALGQLVNDKTLYENITSTTARIDTLVKNFQKDPRLKLQHKIILGDPERKAQRKQYRRMLRERKKVGEQPGATGGR